MLPTKKTYKIQVRETGQPEDEIYLTTYGDFPNIFGIHGNFCTNDDNTLLVGMTKYEIVSWFRKAADLIEEAKFE